MLSAIRFSRPLLKPTRLLNPQLTRAIRTTFPTHLVPKALQVRSSLMELFFKQGGLQSVKTQCAGKDLYASKLFTSDGHYTGYGLCKEICKELEKKTTQSQPPVSTAYEFNRDPKSRFATSGHAVLNIEHALGANLTRFDTIACPTIRQFVGLTRQDLFISISPKKLTSLLFSSLDNNSILKLRFKIGPLFLESIKRPTLLDENTQIPTFTPDELFQQQSPISETEIGIKFQVFLTNKPDEKQWIYFPFKITPYRATNPIRSLLLRNTPPIFVGPKTAITPLLALPAHISEATKHLREAHLEPSYPLEQVLRVYNLPQTLDHATQTTCREVAQRISKKPYMADHEYQALIKEFFPSTADLFLY
jgi:hypothetical protein